MSERPVLLTEVALKSGREVSEILAMLDAQEISAAFMLDDPHTTLWFTGPSPRLEDKAGRCGHRHVRRDGSNVAAVDAVAAIGGTGAFLEILSLHCGMKFQALNKPISRTRKLILGSRGGSRHIAAPATVQHIEAPMTVKVESARPVSGSTGGLWCALYTDVALSDLYIVARDLPKLAATREAQLTEGGRASLEVMLAALARLLGQQDAEFGTQDDPSAKTIAQDAVRLIPNGLISAGSLENAINSGLRRLNDGNATTRRKPGRKPKEGPTG